MSLQYKEGVCEGFTKKYAVKQLVYYEFHETMESAMLREKQLKKWRRQWKLNLIHELNPNGYDLWESIAEV
jgi:putative endonuclease